MKEQVISEILESMAELRVPFTRGGGTDLSVHTEFVDAVSGFGSHKISYESAIFVDEVSITVFMYELTAETGSGVSFGASSEEVLQTGSNVYYKVKNIQYGPDGKAYEYTLNLGSIPQAVKDAAKKYGWKFKQVLSKDKAMYPAGYIAPLPQADAQPLQAQEAPPPPAAVHKPRFCSGCGTALPEGAAFCGKCGKPTNGTAPAAQPMTPPPAPPIQVSAAPQYAPVRPVQTAVQTMPPQYVQPAYAGVPAQPVKKKNTGCIIAAAVTGGVVLVVVVIVVILALSLAKGGMSFTSANIAEAYTSTSIDIYTAEPTGKTNVFSEYDSLIYVTARMQNVPEGTKASSIWYYKPTGESMPSEELELKEDGWIFFNIDSDTGFTAGDYYVELLVDGKVEKTLNFTVN